MTPLATADRLATLREFDRVCAPGGRIVAGLWGPPDKVAFTAISKSMRDLMPEPPAVGGPSDLSALGRLEELFAEAGLIVRASGEADCPFSYPDFETFWQAMASSGSSQKILRIVGEAALRSALQDAAEPFRLDNGGILIQPNIFQYVLAPV